MINPQKPAEDRLLASALKKAGLDTSSLNGIHLAQGVLGKTSVVITVSIIALAAIARVTTSEAIIEMALIFIFIIVILYFCGSLLFAWMNPGTALLEGAKLLQWRQMDIGSNSLPPTIDHNPTNAPEYSGDGE